MEFTKLIRVSNRTISASSRRYTIITVEHIVPSRVGFVFPQSDPQVPRVDCARVVPWDSAMAQSSPLSPTKMTSRVLYGSATRNTSM